MGPGRVGPGRRGRLLLPRVFGAVASMGPGRVGPGRPLDHMTTIHSLVMLQWGRGA